MATKQQVLLLVDGLTKHKEKFFVLSTKEARWAITNEEEAAALCAQAIANHVREKAKHKKAEEVKAINAVVSKTTIPVLAKVTIPASTEEFVVSDKFVVDTSCAAKVKISRLGKSFRKWFLGKVEEPFTGSTVYGHILNEDLDDSSILSELGGSEKVETTMAEIHATMELQPNGERGNLLNDGYANIFYVRDITGTLRVVFVYWYVDGWRVEALSVGHPDGWLSYRQVFSREEFSRSTLLFSPRII